MLLAMLCGLASANTNESITLGSWFTNTEKQDVYTVDAVQLKSKGDAAGLGLSRADGLSYAGFTFSMDISEMMYSTSLTAEDVIKVTQITLASNSQHDSVQTGQLSISLGDYTYVSDNGVESRTSGYGTITYNFTGENAFTLSIVDSLTASIINTTKVSIGVFQGQSGVDGITPPTGYEAWQPGVKVTGILIPEPTTATLSLLALAGLAARRRRR